MPICGFLYTAAVEVGYGPKAVAAVKKQIQVYTVYLVLKLKHSSCPCVLRQADNSVGTTLALVCLLSPKSEAKDASTSESDSDADEAPEAAAAAATADDTAATNTSASAAADTSTATSPAPQIPPANP